MAATIIRKERVEDTPELHRLITEAFLVAPHSSGTEAKIIDALRRDNNLSISLVADRNDVIVAHIVFSPVRINGVSGNWFGLGPVSVKPEYQNQGIGSGIITAGLESLREMKADGCVVLGEPGYYTRFGFKRVPKLILPGVPPEFFLALSFSGEFGQGEVSYHPAFFAS